MTTFQRSRRAFDAYCAMDAPRLPEDPVAARQVGLHRMVGERALADLGAALKALGELALIASAAPAVGPLEDRDRLRALAAERIQVVADALMSFATVHRLDFGELVRGAP